MVLFIFAERLESVKRYNTLQHVVLPARAQHVSFGGCRLRRSQGE